MPAIVHDIRIPAVIRRRGPQAIQSASFEVRKVQMTAWVSKNAAFCANANPLELLQAWEEYARRTQIDWSSVGPSCANSPVEKSVLAPADVPPEGFFPNRLSCPKG